jgi:hypothetical protein
MDAHLHALLTGINVIPAKTGIRTPVFGDMLVTCLRGHDTQSVFSF